METQLSRKYRSKSVDDIIGNKDIVDSLKVIINRKYNKQRLDQSYLITGILGCGKTTIARLLAKIYQCTDPTPNGPCETCGNCMSINNFIETGEPIYEVQEVDITNEDRKKDMDQILENCIHASFSEYTILILDELHRADSGAQNRLLKILEEPPPHLVIIACTTEKEGILPTVRSRFSNHWKVVSPTESEVVNHLARICKQEGINYNRNGLKLLARFSNNIVRTSLNNLEQVVNTRGTVDVADVEEVLSLISDDKIFTVFEYLNNGRLQKYLEWVHASKDAESYFSHLETVFKNGIYAINGALKELTPPELSLYKKTFNNVSIDKFIKIFKVIDDIKSTKLSDELKLIIFGLKYMGYGVEPVKEAVTSQESLAESSKANQNYKEKHQVRKPKKEEPEFATVEDIDKLFGTIFEIPDNSEQTK